MGPSPVSEGRAPVTPRPPRTHSSFNGALAGQRGKGRETHQATCRSQPASMGPSPVSEGRAGSPDGTTHRGPASMGPSPVSEGRSCGPRITVRIRVASMGPSPVSEGRSAEWSGEAPPVDVLQWGPRRSAREGGRGGF